MPSIKSDIMDKTLSSSQGLREFEVQDESQGNLEALQEQFAARGMQLDPEVLRALQAKQAMQQQPKSMAEIEKDFADARKIKANPGRTRLNEQAKRRIELLTGLKRNTRTVTIDEYEYKLQTLKNKELREAILAASAYDGTVELPFETRKQLLARSLTHIAGTEIELFLGTNLFEAKLEFFDELDERISDKLYNEYLALLTEVTNKYSVKTEAEAREVAEDLKK